MTTVNRFAFRVVLPAAASVALFSFPAFAQSQDEQSPSVAEAARRAREQKKKSDKPARVISDDNLKPAPGPTNPPDLQTAKATEPGVSTEGAAPLPGPPEATPPAPPAKAAPAEKKESSNNSAEAMSMKAQLEELQKELDLLQREVPLERDNFYSKPDYTRDTAGKAKLDTLMQQVTDKQQDVEALKARLATLLEQLAKEQPAPAENTEKPATPPQP
jgi:uncharacterized coiled-coil protein SlyX